MKPKATNPQGKRHGSLGEKNQKQKPSGPEPATSVAIPKVPFQVFQFTPVATPTPKARPVVPQADGVLNQNWDRHYRKSMGFPKFGKHLRDLPILGLWFVTNLIVKSTMMRCFVSRPGSRRVFFKGTTPQPGIAVSRFSS